MTIEEYLVDVREIYYQMSARVKGKQILVGSRTHRLTDVRDSNGVLNTIRFATSTGSVLSLPAAIKVDETYFDRAAINFGGVRLVIWPVKEMSDDIRG